jgi:hypothetical protein
MIMQSLISTRSGILRLLLLLLLAASSSCVHYDPGYKELLPKAEANPPENAIVGMWHRKYTDGWGVTNKESVYVKNDHTGYWDYLITDSADPGDPADRSRLCGDAATRDRG